MCRGDLVLTIENLMQKKEKFDYVFIEPSGLADPGTAVKEELTITTPPSEAPADVSLCHCHVKTTLGPLASTFWLDDELESDLYLDSIVTIVDAKHFKQHLEEEKPKGVINEAQRQVALLFSGRTTINCSHYARVSCV